MAEIPTPLVMAQQVHRTPDGSRPLTIGRPLDALRCEQATQRQACHMVAQSATQSVNVPRRCQRVIEPGRYFLAYHGMDLVTGALGNVRLCYCTPCAIDEWQIWAVREATS